MIWLSGPVFPISRFLGSSSAKPCRRLFVWGPLHLATAWRAKPRTCGPGRAPRAKSVQTESFERIKMLENNGVERVKGACPRPPAPCPAAAPSRSLSGMARLARCPRRAGRGCLPSGPCRWGSPLRPMAGPSCWKPRHIRTRCRKAHEPASPGDAGIIRVVASRHILEADVAGRWVLSGYSDRAAREKPGAFAETRRAG